MTISGTDSILATKNPRWPPWQPFWRKNGFCSFSHTIHFRLLSNFAQRLKMMSSGSDLILAKKNPRWPPWRPFQIFVNIELDGSNFLCSRYRSQFLSDHFQILYRG